MYSLGSRFTITNVYTVDLSVQHAGNSAPNQGGLSGMETLTQGSFSFGDDEIDVGYKNATINGWGGVWSIQELFKGTASLHVMLGNCEGGWGYNDEYTNILGFLTDVAKTNRFSDAEIVANPIFRTFDNAMLHQTNRIYIAKTELNKVMGDGIPALSFAAGANEIPNFSVLQNINLQSTMLNGWPEVRQQREGQYIINKWLHSDVKNVAFFYVYRLFKKIVQGE